MTVTITDPELIRFVEEEVRSGRSASPDAAVAAVLAERAGTAPAGEEDGEFDDATATLLNESFGRRRGRPDHDGRGGGRPARRHAGPEAG
jgi:hypothetical protein